MNSKLRFSNSNVGDLLMAVIAACCCTFAAFIAVTYADQLPLDVHRFRQTQTALTSYWLVENGFSFSYETPVAGPPWNIPFEFPIYQYIVALASQLFGCSLEVAGRISSFLFLVLCLVPVRSINRKLQLPNSVFIIFSALLFSSPLYLYWGRTFMIETMALFFAVLSITYFIDIVQKISLRSSTCLFLLSICLSILQKATTGLPVLAVLSFTYLFLVWREAGSIAKLITTKRLWLGAFYFGVPLLVAIAWTSYTDYIKSMNELGMQLTSGALNSWNWGSLEQRLSSKLYTEVIWQRVFQQNLAGVVGIVILLTALISTTTRSVRLYLIVSILMGMAPLFIFTNLHIVHRYYQTANVLFLIYAIALSVGYWTRGQLGRSFAALLVTLVFVSSNYLSYFSSGYHKATIQKFDKANSRDIAVSEVLKREIPGDQYFVVFGNDWSSSLAYLSERKSFTVPEYFAEYGNVASHPEQYFEPGKLGSVIVCPVAAPSIHQLMEWAQRDRQWKVGKVTNCYIALPEGQVVDVDRPTYPVQCEGNIDAVEVLTDGTNNNLLINGWMTLSGADGAVPERVYLRLQKGAEQPLYLGTLKLNRPDVSDYFHIANSTDSGYSRLINTDSLSDGDYTIGIHRVVGGRQESCQFEIGITVNGHEVVDIR